MRILLQSVSLLMWVGLSLVTQEIHAMTPTEFFTKLNKNNLELVDQFYEPDAVLIDPMGQMQGTAAIRGYFKHQYDNVEEISWHFEPEIVQGNNRVLVWQMTLKTKVLNGGKAYTVPGISKFILGSGGKAKFHQDYFDAGAFIYERLPVLRNLIQFIKGRMSPEVAPQKQPAEF